MTESVNEADAVRARLTELQCLTRLVSVLGISWVACLGVCIIPPVSQHSQGLALICLCYADYPIQVVDEPDPATIVG